jgi:hypothetical protein
MNDLERATIALDHLENPCAMTARALLEEIILTNQYPERGGDRQMSVTEWQLLVEALDALRKLSEITEALLAPRDADDVMLDGASEPVQEPRVVSASAEGSHVFALLSDERILQSRQLDNPNCAQLHADQVIRLQLSAKFLTGILKWSESEV